ncbi:histidinol dehydrogenase [Peptococcaceae bacterium]|nr:histidinol dehydrogenase [Peptococcaceae bacterium]
MIKVLNSNSPELQELLTHNRQHDKKIMQAVSEIIDKVINEKDDALLELTLKFDGVKLAKSDLKVSENEIEEAYELIDKKILEYLKLASKRIWDFHSKQRLNSWFEPDKNGTILGQLVLPIERVGVYVPGGKAAYPSSVLMNVVPAKVAGVKEIVMVTPPDSNGKINPYVLVAARETGVNEIYKVGGAQAIAALAYGTDTVKAVDKITGPGNIYVTLAKKLVYGDVDIDMLAGPSEILVIADENASAAYVAADMLSQAEHDEIAASMLITPCVELADKVKVKLEEQLQTLPKRAIAEKALKNRGVIIIVNDLNEAFDIANKIAPEHLEILVQNPFDWIGKVRHAGSVFLGEYSPEPVGDYIAGPNHVLPTSGTARFYSGLNVDAFVKKTTIISFSKTTFEKLKESIINLAEVEGLTAHANAVRVRK